MSNVNTFDAYVRRRLEAWGYEFALHRDCEYLGHKSKDMLQVLIEHKGEMPSRPTGFRPLEIPPLEMQIEDIVADIARSNLDVAQVLRAYYCGTGRRAVERLAQARHATDRNLSRRQYFDLHDCGFKMIADAIQKLEQGKVA